MPHMLPGRAARGWSACCASLVVVLGFTASAFAESNEPSLPKPDLPPRSAPRPAPAPAPATPEPVAPASVAPAPVAPVPTARSGPSAAQRRAAAARRARERAARLARVAHQAAEQRAAVAAAHRRERAQTDLATPAAGSATPGAALAFLVVAFSAALVLLGLALTPAWAIPWRRASLLLEDRRDELGVIGAMSLAATMLFFLLVQMTS